MVENKSKTKYMNHKDDEYIASTLHTYNLVMFMIKIYFPYMSQTEKNIEKHIMKETV